MSDEAKKPRGDYRMGRIFCKNGRYYYRYSWRGVRHEEAAGAERKDAVALQKKRLAEMVSGHLVGPSAERLTFADLDRMVLDDYAIKQRRSTPPLGRLRDYFPAHTRALDITPDAVRSYVKHRLAQGAAAATVKHEVGVLGRALTLAVESGHLPFRRPLPMPAVNNARKGFFTDADMARLLDALPEYLRDLTEAAYITGWRRGELIRLQWAEVDWETGTMRLERGTTKSGEPRSFPFTAHPRMAALLRGLYERAVAHGRATGEMCPWVFHRNGRQVKGWYYDAWQTACKEAGVPGRLFHDLRRSAVRNLVRAGVSENVAMTLSGHKTRSVFDRYHIISAQDQADAVRSLAKLQGATAPEPRKVVGIEEARHAQKGETRGKDGHADAL